MDFENVLIQNGSYETFRYYYYDLWQSMGDPRVQAMPLMDGGPWATLSIIAFYVYFVKVLGPVFMEHRPPFDLRRPIFWYNIFMVVINALFFAYATYFTNFGINTWICNNVDPTANDAEWQFKLRVGWLFFFSKFIDLLDTVFFVLRKKYNQVSALHVIHHSLVPINVWMGLKYVPSESAAFMPFINSFIHCIMYLYYALSTLGPAVRPYLWWKKYLTTLQIIQIALVAFHCLYIAYIPACNLPKMVFLVAFPQSLLVLAMFCSFFTKSYTKSEHNGKEIKNKLN
ncbi:elongation of very long chain fatty acids protein-like isoform X2 [Leptotrombidium deliense]|uniref:Elongation of very long chain fatty acids protein n=1 Tax=Leptotrombidium deliense TaxID=299467 RepID=A0A443S655_9ACAR|nr:elongation of very long chain fatty acids protein-like isoform X2 [Leptotrombidium deliense]